MFLAAPVILVEGEESRPTGLVVAHPSWPEYFRVLDFRRKIRLWEAMSVYFRHTFFWLGVAPNVDDFDQITQYTQQRKQEDIVRGQT